MDNTVHLVSERIFRWKFNWKFEKLRGFLIFVQPVVGLFEFDAPSPSYHEAEQAVNHPVARCLDFCTNP